MSAKPLARVDLACLQRVAVDLPTVDVLLLDVIAKATDKPRGEVVSEALHVLFAALPRRDD